MDIADLQDLQKMLLGLRGPRVLPLVDPRTRPQVKARSHLGPFRPNPWPPGILAAYPLAHWDLLTFATNRKQHLGFVNEDWWLMGHIHMLWHVRYALKKKNDIIWEFFPTWGGVFPNPKTFVNFKNSAFLGQKQCFLGKKCTITWYILHISYFILHISYFFG